MTPFLCRCEADRISLLLSLRGARFLAYASEQAPQSLPPPVVARLTKSAEAISVGDTGIAALPLRYAQGFGSPQ
ncbi:MAG TPA: hypothetical protein VMV76_04990 [Dehalococcoidia bacterium]|nr:hypothetical protein [Dehalococcoidia bacterium]